MADNENHSSVQDFHGRLEVAVRSIISPTAQGRTENEDNYLIIDAEGKARFLLNQQETFHQVGGWSKGQIRLAILDGLGGHSRGREATEKTVTGLLQIPAATEIGTLTEALKTLHTRLHREMHRYGEEPGCTLTMLEILPSGTALLFHVGDSRLYVIDAEGPGCLTVDHVPATQFAMLGMIDEEEWLQQVHERPGSQLSQAFILGNTLDQQTVYRDRLNEGLFELHDGNLPAFLKGCGDRRPIALEPDCVYLLASDGLWHLSRPGDFILRWPEILVQPDKPLPVLLDDLFKELAATMSQEKYLKGDNSTAIAIRVLA